MQGIVRCEGFRGMWEEGLQGEKFKGKKTGR